jgi:hypothetical protein
MRRGGATKGHPTRKLALLGSRDHRSLAKHYRQQYKSNDEDRPNWALGQKVT